MADSPPGVLDATRNRLLASLSGDEYARLAPTLERVEVELTQVLFNVDRPIEHVYFPEGAVVSVVSVMADGTAVETATIGREGMVGCRCFSAADRRARRPSCRSPGRRCG